jgi:hypothetical protein
MTDHIVMLRGTSTMKCLHCHQSYNINMPCPSLIFTAIMDKFIEMHNDCEVKDETETSVL